MTNPLEQQIAALRRRVKTVLLTYAAACTFATLVTAVVVAAVADYVVRFDDPGLRLLVSLGVFAAAAWAVYRYLLPSVQVRHGDVDLALRIERRYPELADRLASTVQFIEQDEDDLVAGSPTLRRAVVARTMADLAKLDVGDVVDVHPARRATILAAAVGLVAVLLAALDPSAVGIALARMSAPLGATTWPKDNHLMFVDPARRLAAGEDFEVALVDRDGAELPDSVRIHYRFRTDGANAVETVDTMRFVDGKMIARKENITRPFAFRAEGGDDDSMPWIDLEVVEPPVIEQSSLTLHYPEYTGWPPETTDPHIRALEGSRVSITARTTKQLTRATLVRDDGRELPARLDADGFGFSLPADAETPFLVDHTGAYWFVLEDLEGFRGGAATRYEVRAIVDEDPVVAVEQPRANVFVTSDAVVPVRILAKDDLAILRVTLGYVRSDQSESGEVEIPLYQGPQRVVTADFAGGHPPQESRVIDHDWDLGPMELAPGVQLTLFATATDYRPSTGHSQPRRLTIVTAEQLQDRIAERQSFILDELARVLDLERDARGQVQAVEIQLDQVGDLGHGDVDQLQRAELIQRQVERGLTSESEGVQSHIAELLAELENNRIDSPDVERRMQGLAEGIRQLADDRLPAVAREMTAALKASQRRLQDEEPTANSARMKESVAATGEHQDAVIATLEQMLGDLSQWENYRRFYREIGQLRAEQEELSQDTAELGRQTLTRDVNDLVPQQKADLEKLAQRQLDSARRFDHIQQRMKEMSEPLRPEDPLAADAISDAMHHARERAIAGTMREAGANLGENQIGQALDRQQQLAEDLEEMLEILADRRERELAQLVKKLTEAEQELADLRERQEGLKKRIQEAERQPDEAERERQLQRLTREQRQLQEEAERFARKLRRLQAERASQAAARGAARMGQAGDQAEQGDAGQSAEQAAAAERDLDEAQQELAQQRRQAEIDLAMDQLARLEDTLAAARDRQARLLEETENYERLRAEQGALTRAQALGVRDLARQQQTLEEETAAMAERLAGAAAFRLALEGAALEMRDAAKRLALRDTTQPTQRAERNARDRFELVLRALNPDQDDEQQDDHQGGQGGQGGQPGGQQPERDLSELVLLKLLQESINLRTEQLAAASAEDGPTLTPDEEQEYTRLSREQGELADLLLNMTQPSDDAAPTLPQFELESPTSPGRPLPPTGRFHDPRVDSNGKSVP